MIYANDTVMNWRVDYKHLEGAFLTIRGQAWSMARMQRYMQLVNDDPGVLLGGSLQRASRGQASA